MPPKRKASSTTGDVVDNEASPTPRKKTKAESKARAKEWSEARRKEKEASASSSGVTSISAPVLVASGEQLQQQQDASDPKYGKRITKTGGGKVLSKNKKTTTGNTAEWHETRTTAVASSSPSPVKSATSHNAKATSRYIKKNEAVAEGKSSNNKQITKSKASIPLPMGGTSLTKRSGTGGNEFLKSLRASTPNTPEACKKEDPPSFTSTTVISQENTVLPPIPNSVPPLPSQSISTPKPKHFVGKVLRFILFCVVFTLNRAVIIGMIQHQSSLFEEFERISNFELSKLTSELPKSIEMEAVLRSAVQVLEEKVQRMKEAVQHFGSSSSQEDNHGEDEKPLEQENQDAITQDKHKFLDTLAVLEEQLGGEMN